MRPTVLLIDDDRDFRESVRLLLESRGYDVVEAESGREGLRLVAARKPDAILLDVMMETSIEGYSVTHALKYGEEYAAFREIPLFMVSTIQESPDERFPLSPEVEMIRPDRYLSKPLDIPRFFELLEQAVARKPGCCAPSPAAQR